MASESSRDIDHLLRGGRVETFGDARGFEETAQSIAIRGGRILAVGTDDALEPLVARARRVIDLEGRRVIPGLNDSHIHAVRAGASWSRALHWDDARSVDEALRSVRRAAERRPPGSWIAVIGGWHSRQFVEGRPPTVQELDAAAPNHPVYVQELYDRGFLNTLAQRSCGWDTDSTDPVNGRLLRDGDGTLSGEIRGVGAFAVPTNLALAVTPEEQVEGTIDMMRSFASHGLTGVVDGGGMMMSPSSYDALYEVWRRREMSVRFRLYISAWTRGGEVGDIDRLTELSRPDFGDGFLAISGVGEMPHMGCHDMEGLETDFAIHADAAGELAAITRRCVDKGWRMSVHAVLDSSLSTVLDVWESVPGVAGRRFSIVHADQASPTNLKRIAALGAGILVQNRLMLKSADYVEAWGEAAAVGSPPLGLMRANGIVIGGGSDATRANWFSPWASLAWLVTGQTVDGSATRELRDRLTLRQAIATYTRDAAWFTGEERHRGRIQPGFDADLCVPDADPFEVEPGELGDIRSDLTVTAGAISHAAGEFEGLSPAIDVA